MKKEILNPSELIALGFVELQGDELDNKDYYRWWKFHKNDSDLYLTYQYSSNNEFQLGYFEFNGSLLNGRQLTKDDVKLIIEIM
ncbi:MAG: hypothetical protein V4497_01370 [Bacteroidota bacterium]